ncbi:hypothetical protein J4N37_09090 [Vibrio sp. SCSIO 43153]|uniref:hypothetical protein n=1 Tax=Vibrio sp. SCSIO 43153 TaxID=2819098 RepID=UPI002074C0E7|nr:hypothetical protein [Vibrio sp. SCSIO 43153]USD48779.1 hypothetical protein J4N37_09090 [Vibrio sp. SCSIO 43153]
MGNEVLTSDVFKTSRELPLNYVSRKHADQCFLDALTEDSHLVIHGSSKQGKTSLRKNNLMEKDYIDITCSNNWDLDDLHVAILKEAGYTVTTSESKTIKGKSKIRLKFELPFVKGPSVTGDVGYEQAKQVNKQNLELDPGDVNDVIRALSEINFERYIVVEDFHYLPEDTQIDFSIALKAFHEASKLCFIIVGVWLEEDRLTVHNGDLTGRVTSINADLWKEEDLDELFTISESLLNISFAEQFVQDVKKYCNGSIFLVQRLCHESCKAKDITKTQLVTTLVGDDFDVQAKIRELLESQNSRYLRFLTDFSAGFDQTKLDLYKWILFALIETETQALEKGLPAAAIRRIIEKKHPKRSELSHKKLLQALRKSVDLQVKSRIQPIVFEYDSNTTRVKIVDRSFLLWREFQDKNDLLDHADLTDEIKTNIVTEI